MKPNIVIKLTEQILLELLKGKTLHIIRCGIEIEIIPPFDGIFLTYEEIVRCQK